MTNGLMFNAVCDTIEYGNLCEKVLYGVPLVQVNKNRSCGTDLLQI